MLKQYDIPEDHYQQSGIFILNRDCGTITQPPGLYSTLSISAIYLFHFVIHCSLIFHFSN